MPVICSAENCGQPAVLKRPKTGHALCKECFFFAFETEIHVTIVKGNLFKSGYKVAIGASGGKDSTVLAFVLKLLNERHNYGLDLFLLSIDEGISGYRNDSLETVKQNRDDYKLPLKILSYKDLYGWTMDEIVAQIGHKNNCTFCGVFRRQALDRGAAILGVDMIVTGHNADDMAETIIMNVLRGDIARLSRCTNIITEGEGTIPRCKPLKYAYEKEIVMYAHYKELVYFSTECIYSPNAYRGYTREYIKEVERIRPSCILDIIHSGETVELKECVKFPIQRTCIRCGFIASQEICKACVLLEGLNIGVPKLGIGKSNKAKKMMGLKVHDGSENKTKNKEPRTESKRKIKRENKKKLTCKESCVSNCSAKISESTIMDNIDLSFLTLQQTTCEGQEMDKSSIDNFMLTEFSDDEELVVKPKKEKVVCKCPPNLKLNINSNQLHNIDEMSSSSDDEVFNIDVFTSLLKLNNLSEEASTTLDIPQNFEFELKYELNNTNNKPSSSKIELETANLQSIHQSDNFRKLQSSSIQSACQEPQSTDYFESTDNTKSSFLLLEDSEHSKSECIPNIDDINLLIDESSDKKSKIRNISCNKEQSLDELPTIIKAKPKTIKPSLILPEMMYKAKNNLDF